MVDDLLDELYDLVEELHVHCNTLTPEGLKHTATFRFWTKGEDLSSLREGAVQGANLLETLRKVKNLVEQHSQDNALPPAFMMPENEEEN